MGVKKGGEEPDSEVRVLQCGKLGPGWGVQRPWHMKGVESLGPIWTKHTIAASCVQ